MSSMENLKGKAADAAQAAAKTAKYVALVSKNKFAIVNEKEKIRRNYTRLGKIYYKDFVTDEEPDRAEYDPICESISASFRHIEVLREEIAAAKAEFGDDAAAAETEPEPETEEAETEPETAEEPEANPETTEEPETNPETETAEPDPQ